MDEVLESLKDRIINPKPEECLDPFAVVINYIVNMMVVQMTDF